MSPSEQADLVAKNPSQPHCSFWTVGDRVVVAESRKTLASKITLCLRAWEDIEKPLGKVSMVAIPNITMVALIDPAQRARSGRRRRRGCTRENASPGGINARIRSGLC